MKKLFIVSKKTIFSVCAILTCSCMAFADEPNRTVKQYDKECTTVKGEIVGNGGSTKTCVTTYPDGSKTTTIESCTKTGASASVGVAKGGFEKDNCKITEINEPAPKSSNNDNNR